MFRSSLTGSLLGVLLRGVGWSALAVAVSLPVVRLIHDHFGLGVPPFNGVVILSFGVVAAFLGAGIGGALLGIFAKQTRAPISLLAAFGGLIWGLATVMWLVPTYGGIVVDDIASSGASIVWRDRNDLIPRGKSAIEAFQKGQREQATRTALQPYADDVKNVAIQSAAKLPALSILGWALIGPPLLAAWECRGARRRR